MLSNSNFFKQCIIIVALLATSCSMYAVNIDSLSTVAKSETHPDQARVLAMTQLSSYYLRKDTILSFSYAQEAFELSESANDPIGIIKSTESIARYHTEQGRYKEAKSYLFTVINQYDPYDYPADFAALYISLANIHDIQSEFDLALDNYLKSEELFISVNDKRGAGLAQMGIANIYNTTENHDDAIAYYSKSYKNLLKESPKYASWSINNMALSLMAIDEDDSALFYFDKSLTMKLSLDDMYGASYTYSDMGMMFEKLEAYDKAIESYKEALEIKLSLEGINPETIGASFNNIGRLYFIGKEYATAISNLKKGLEYSEKSGSLTFQVESYKYLSESYSKLGEYKEAYDHGQRFSELSDSLGRYLHSNNLSELEVQYKTEQKEKDIIMLNDSITLQEKTLKLQDLQVKEEQQKNQMITILLVGAIIVIVLVLGLGWVLYRSNLDKKKANELLARTNQEISLQKDIIEEKHREITDSINYAERIQRSFLASAELLSQNLKDYFVLYKPKDVVSGDFYWAGMLNNGAFAYCCADSTGHGVPGAIMSILNISSIEKAIEQEIEPHLILNRTRDIIIERLKKDGSEEGGKDGMDCSLLLLKPDRSELMLASANNPVIIVRDGDVLEFKGDKMPVGKHTKDTESFSLRTVPLQSGDMIYTLTDGFQDQFGGERNKKFMIKNLRSLFQKIAHLNVDEQREILENEFEQWKGDIEQVDDLCIVGFRA